MTVKKRARAYRLERASEPNGSRAKPICARVLIAWKRCLSYLPNGNKVQSDYPQQNDDAPVVYAKDII
jgi:hypothetical protein